MILFFNIHVIQNPYIYCHSQTDYFVVSQLFSVARHAGRFKLGSKPAQLYVRLSILLFSQQVTHVSSEIITHYVLAFVCLHFCVCGYQMVGCLVVWVLWHINLCRLCNTKSILYANNQFYFKQFSLAWIHSLIWFGSISNKNYLILLYNDCSFSRIQSRWVFDLFIFNLKFGEAFVLNIWESLSPV